MAMGLPPQIDVSFANDNGDPTMVPSPVAIAALQPMVGGDGRVVLTEALTRFRRADGVFEGPGRLLASSLDQQRGHLFRMATRVLAATEGVVASVSVNIAVEQLTLPIVRALLSRLAPHARRRLVLEVVESPAPWRDETVEALAGLRRAGVRICMDDYTGGWCDAWKRAQLVEAGVGLDFLKLPRPWVAMLGTSVGRFELLALRRALEHSRRDDMPRTTVVLEGVGHHVPEEVRNHLYSYVDLLQGYCFLPRRVCGEQGLRGLTVPGLRRALLR